MRKDVVLLSVVLLAAVAGCSSGKAGPTAVSTAPAPTTAATSTVDAAACQRFDATAHDLAGALLPVTTNFGDRTTTSINLITAEIKLRTAAVGASAEVAEDMAQASDAVQSLSQAVGAAQDTSSALLLVQAAFDKVTTDCSAMGYTMVSNMG